MKCWVAFAFFLLPFELFSQSGMRPVKELIDTKNSAWPIVLDWKRVAKKPVDILPKEVARATEALFQTQVTTRSPMGAIVYESGGIIVDGGWIRILGSGSIMFVRSLPSWNTGKILDENGKPLGFMLVADDAVGGFFAINGGLLDTNNLGKVFYLAPDTLEWEPLGLSYSELIQFCFSGDLEHFYKGLRWKQWKRDANGLRPDQAFNFAPPLFTKEGKDIEKDSRKVVPVEEIWNLQMSFKKGLGIR